MAARDRENQVMNTFPRSSGKFNFLKKQLPFNLTLMQLDQFSVGDPQRGNGRGKVKKKSFPMRTSCKDENQ